MRTRSSATRFSGWVTSPASVAPPLRAGTTHLDREVDLRLAIAQLDDRALATRLDRAVFAAVPCHALVGLEHRGLGVPFDALARWRLHHPVRRAIRPLLDGFDVLHEVGEVLEVRPGLEDLFDAGPHDDALGRLLGHGFTSQTGRHGSLLEMLQRPCRRAGGSTFR